MKTKKHLIAAASIFLIIMIIFTVVSKHIAISALPKVITSQQFFDITIPKDSLIQTLEGDTYVYVVMTEPTILGEQYVVERVKVKVIKTKKDKVLIDSGDYSYEIIIKSDSEITEGQRVRKELQ